MAKYDFMSFGEPNIRMSPPVSEKELRPMKSQ